MLSRQLTGEHEARRAETLALVRARVEDAQAQLRREATLLAGDESVVAGATTGDWAALARGGSARLRTLTVGGVADLVLILDATGAPLAQVPALPRITLPDGLAVTTDGAATLRLARLGASVFVLAVASIEAGAAGRGGVVVGRRLERLDAIAPDGVPWPRTLWLVGDEARASTLPGAPASGWNAAARRGSLAVSGAPWVVRPISRTADGDLWALLPDASFRDERRRLWIVLSASFVLAAAGGAALVWGSARFGAGGDRRARAPTVDPDARRQAEHMAAIAGLGRLVSETLDPDLVGQRSADSIRALLGAKFASVYRLTEPGDLVVLAVSGVAPTLWRKLVFPRGIGLANLAVRDRRPMVTPDVLDDPRVVLTADTRARIDEAGYRAVLTVPLLVQERVIGALTVGDSRGRRFDADEIRLAQAFADQVGIALENARLYAEATRRRREAEELARLVQTLTESLDVEAVGQRIVDGVLPFFAAGSSGLRLLEPDGSLVALAMGGRSQPAFARGHVAPPGAGASGRAVAEGKPVTSADVFNDPAIALTADLDEGIRAGGDGALLAVPLRVKGRIIGALSIGDETGRVFSEAEGALLQAFADHAAIALDNARLYADQEKRAVRLRTLARLNHVVTGSLQPDEVLGEIARAAAKLMEAPVVTFWAVNETARTVELRALSDDHFELDRHLRVLPFGQGSTGWVAEHRQPLTVADAFGDPRFIAHDWRRRHGLTSFFGIPILVRGSLLGVLTLDAPRPFHFTPEDEDLLQNFVTQAGIALENARLYSVATRRLEETRALLEVAEILNSTLDSTRLLKRVAMKVAQVCRADRCSIELWDGDRVIPLMSQFADGRKAPALWAAFNEGTEHAPRAIPAHARAIATLSPVMIDDTATTDLIPREWIDSFGLKSYLVVPLVSQGTVIGVMNLDYCERVTPFQEWQVNLATAIAGPVALSLENTRLYAEAQERLRETTALLAVGRALARPDSTAAIMRGVLREVTGAFGADMAGAYFLDERKESLVPLVGYHVPPDLIEVLLRRPMVLGQFPALRDAWRKGRASWSADVLNDPRFDQGWASGLPPHSVLFASATAHGEPVGGLFLVWWRTGRTFSPAEIRLIEGVAGQVGLAIENMDLARQTKQKLAETEALLSVSRALSSTLDLESMLRHFLRSVARAVDADCVGAWMLAADGETMEAVAGYHVPPQYLDRLQGLRFSTTAHPFFEEAVRTRRPVSSSHVMSDPRFPDALRQAAPHTSHLFVPIVANERVIGGFASVWWDREREFSPGELTLMEAIASQAGVAIENARLFEENRRQVKELSVLHELSRAVTGQLDREALLEAIQVQVARVLDVANMVIALGHPEVREFEVVRRVVDGVKDMREPLRYSAADSGLLAVVLETGVPLRTDDYRAECARRGVRPVAIPQMRHWLGAPMRAGDRVIGALALRGRDRAFTEAEERLFANIGHLAALALDSARLFEERTRAYGELAAAQDHLVRTEKLRALGEMASGVAHDFNNLLAAILGRAQLLLRRVHEPQLREWLEVIERSTLDGAQTVRRLQEFTRIRRDQPLVAVDLNEVVREALEITESRWRQEPASRGITIDVRTSPGVMSPVAGNPAELREALTNLILNAVDAMPGGGTLTLTTAGAGDRMEVTVADTGVGMPAAVRQKIFDPFFTTKGPQGTGLGLSMTYGILARHGASINVESEEGRGSTFVLSFPTSEAPPAPEPSVSAPATPAPPLRCLVVDDEQAVGSVLADILETVGHSAVVFVDGAQAITRFRAERFDAVFTDLAMPRVSGWQVARAVKDIAPTVPVFLVTGFGVELSPAERRRRGVDAVLTKPLQIQDVLDAVAGVVRARAGAEPGRGRA